MSRKLDYIVIKSRLYSIAEGGYGPGAERCGANGEGSQRARADGRPQVVHVGADDYRARHLFVDPNAKIELEEFNDVIGPNFKQPKEGLGFDNSPVAHMWRAVIRPAKYL